MTSSPDLPYCGRRRFRSRSNPKTVKPLTLRLLPLLALALSLPLLFTGGRLLLAGIASYQAQAFLQDWSSKNKEPDARAWQIAHDAAQRAIVLYPAANGGYLHRLGLIHEWRHRDQPIGDTRTQASRRAALEAFRGASAAQPNWPDHWSAIAYNKLHLMEIDDEFGHALAQAHKLGPARIQVNRRLAEVGFVAWVLIDEDQEKITLEAARRTVAYSNREAQQLLEVADLTGMTDTLCSNLDDELKTQRKICN